MRHAFIQFPRLQEMMPNSYCTQIAVTESQRIYLGITDVVFAWQDMSGFTKLSSQISAEDLVTLIHAIFTSIDYLADCICNIWKVETVGDCYIGVVGGPNACDDHAHRAVVFALSILENVKRISERTQLPLKVKPDSLSPHSFEERINVADRNRQLLPILSRQI